MNLVRCMLNENKVPKCFWPEAVQWTSHILNRSPTSILKDKTPIEMWSGNRPSVEHFKIFGCIAHVHVPDQRRKKLDDKSIPCIMIGVSSESKAYRLFNPATNKVMISRDVVFEENKGWDWSITKPELDNLIWDGCEDEQEDESDNEEHVDVDKCKPSETEMEAPATPTSERTNVEDSEQLEQRVRRPPSYLRDYVTNSALLTEVESDWIMFADRADPVTYEEAAMEERWRVAMDQEMKAIEKNNTWRLTDLPHGAKKIGVKWVYKTKLNKNGELDKYKARLVVKGYTQKYGLDYSEVFAPVARWDTIRTILALATHKKWRVLQLDVKSAFLYGDLIEDVYVEQPLGYIHKDASEKVYKLRKALYGLKQASRAWYSRIEEHFTKVGFTKCSHEHTLFTKTSADGTDLLIVSIYVDDLIITGNDSCMLREFKESMQREFEMTDLGEMKYFLGVEILQTHEGIYLNQKKYAAEILERFNLTDCNSVMNPIVPGEKHTIDRDGHKADATLYKQLIGSLLYITATRPDLMYAVCLLSRYMAAPTETHMQAAKKILRYLKGTLKMGLCYKVGDGKLLGYTDSDYAGDMDDRKSTSGYVFYLGEAAISWASNRQPVVTLSTTEAEYVAAASSATQCVWLRTILEQLGLKQEEGTIIWCDNSSTIKLSKNPMMHGRSKHIDVRFHFLRNLIKEGTMELMHCNTEDQVADIMTKPLKREAYENLRKELRMCEMPSV